MHRPGDQGAETDEGARGHETRSSSTGHLTSQLCKGLSIRLGGTPIVAKGEDTRTQEHLSEGTPNLRVKLPSPTVNEVCWRVLRHRMSPKSDRALRKSNSRA